MKKILCLLLCSISLTTYASNVGTETACVGSESYPDRYDYEDDFDIDDTMLIDGIALRYYLIRNLWETERNKELLDDSFDVYTYYYMYGKQTVYLEMLGELKNWKVIDEAK